MFRRRKQEEAPAVGSQEPEVAEEPGQVEGPYEVDRVLNPGSTSTGYLELQDLMNARALEGFELVLDGDAILGSYRNRADGYPSLEEAMSRAREIIERNRRRNEPNAPQKQGSSARPWLEAVLELAVIGLLLGGIGTAIVLPFIGIPLVVLILVGYGLIKLLTRGS